MKVHYFQHVPFENPACILSWAEDKKHSLTKTLLYENEDPPAAPDFDLLVVMGGPMSIYEHDKYPWLVAEKEAILRAIGRGKRVIGICLGGQLIADILGGKVTRNPHKEIGWMPVVQTTEIMRTSPFDKLPREYVAFHWHGETFSIPPGAVLQSSSAACANQGFMYTDKVIGFQYHIEATAASVGALVENCAEELIDAPYIHKAEKILSDTGLHQKSANGLMETLLETWLG
jgi:GMP synthase-like glutamine amidotransferase